MRHLLFNRMNPPPETVWQRRWSSVKRFGRNLVTTFALTVQGFSMMAMRYPGAGGALLLFAIHEQFQQAPEVGPDGVVVVKAWVNFVVQIVIVIVAAIVAIAMAPKPPQPKPAALADFDVPTAEEGRPIAKVFGECWIKDPNNLWYGDLRADPIKKKGGKK